MLTIGLTGGIGSGKSEVARMLERLGALLVDADVVGHGVYRKGAPAWRRVVDAFGEEVVGADGEIDRRRLGAVVFGGCGRLKELTDIVWPGIREALRARITAERTGGRTEVLVIEAAVLFEAGWDELCDEAWVVEAPEAAVLDRLEAARGMERADAQARIRAQMTTWERAGRAAVHVQNSGDLAALAAAVEKLWHERTERRHNGQ